MLRVGAVLFYFYFARLDQPIDQLDPHKASICLELPPVPFVEIGISGH